MPRTKPKDVRQRRRLQVQRLSNRHRLRELRGQSPSVGATQTQPSTPAETATQA